MDDHEVLALTIWWCEGTKARRDKRWKNAFLYPVEVINSNPKIIKIFIDYLLNELHVSRDKIKGQIQIHKGDNLEGIENFWSKKLAIPKSQFNKTIVRPKGNKPGKNLGTFKVRLYDKTIYFELSRRLENILIGV